MLGVMFPFKNLMVSEGSESLSKIRSGISLRICVEAFWKAAGPLVRITRAIVPTAILFGILLTEEMGLAAKFLGFGALAEIPH